MANRQRQSALVAIIALLAIPLLPVSFDNPATASERVRAEKTAKADRTARGAASPQQSAVAAPKGVARIRAGVIPKSP